MRFFFPFKIRGKVEEMHLYISIFKWSNCIDLVLDFLFQDLQAGSQHVNTQESDTFKRLT